VEKTLTISLDPKLPRSDVDGVLKRIGAVIGVAEAGLIAPESKNPVARSIGYVLLDQGSDASEAAKRVAAIPGVVSCNVPPGRRAL
jgi:hypothetical protein